MDSRGVYWTRVPKVPEAVLIAVEPFLDIRDGRLKFRAAGSGVWQLTGTLTGDSEKTITFSCDDAVMGQRGGKYVLKYLTLKDFKEWVGKHVDAGGSIAEHCLTTEDLHFWYRHNFPNRALEKFARWELANAARKGSEYEKERAKNRERMNKQVEDGLGPICYECHLRGETGRIIKTGSAYKCTNCGVLWDTKSKRYMVPPALAKMRAEDLNRRVRERADCPKCDKKSPYGTGMLYPLKDDPDHIFGSWPDDYKTSRYFQCDICAALWDTEKMEWIGNYRSVW